MAHVDGVPVPLQDSMHPPRRPLGDASEMGIVGRHFSVRTRMAPQAVPVETWS